MIEPTFDHENEIIIAYENLVAHPQLWEQRFSLLSAPEKENEFYSQMAIQTEGEISPPPCNQPNANQFLFVQKHDSSLLAQFYYADEELNSVATELDSFDGRKDPERCASLVYQLRQCQDKV